MGEGVAGAEVGGDILEEGGGGEERGEHAGRGVAEGERAFGIGEGACAAGGAVEGGLLEVLAGGVVGALHHFGGRGLGIGEIYVGWQ